MTYTREILTHLFNQAVSLYNEGQLINSYKILQKIILIEPFHYKSLKYIALIYKSQGNFIKAIDYLNKIPKDKHDSEIYYLYGLCYFYDGQINKAIDFFQLSINLDPSYFICYANLASCLQLIGKYNEAIINYNKYLAYDKTNPEIYNNIGLIHESLNNFLEAEKNYKKAIELNSNKEIFFINLAGIFQKQEKYIESINAFSQAIKINPNDSDTYNNLGVSYQTIGEYNKSIENYKKAISLNKNISEFYNNLASAYEMKNDLLKAKENYELSITLLPDNKKAYYNLGVLYEKLNLYDNAIEEYRKAISIDNNFAEAHVNLSICLLLKEDFIEGWKEYEWRLIADNYRFEKGIPVWNGEDLTDKSILIISEQGAGDCIQFSRYINLLKQKNTRIIFQCPDNLIELFKQSFSVECISKKENDKHYDYQIYLMSLPNIFHTTKNNIPVKVPYIFTDKELNVEVKEKIEKSNLRIGIVWAGNKYHKNNLNRSCDLKYFSDLAKKLNISFFSLQKDGVLEKNENIIDLSGYINSYYDTASLIKKMDLIISVDTSVIHLSAAMNKDSWLLLGDKSDWRWGRSVQTSMWYPSVKVFRKEEKDWSYIFACLYDNLKKY